MTANEYQQQRAEDNGNVPFEEARVLYSLGIAGEAGEVADYMKKVIGHGKEYDRSKLVDELGDVLWYISQLAHIHGIQLEEIMTMNTIKLRERYPHGFQGDLPHWTERTKVKLIDPQPMETLPTNGAVFVLVEVSGEEHVRSMHVMTIRTYQHEPERGVTPLAWSHQVTKEAGGKDE